MSVEEAQIALECGADIIDCKNPASGALGALPNETISGIVKLVNGRHPVSATVGDLPMQPRVICEAMRSKITTAVDYVKIGVFRNGLPNECIQALAPLTKQTSLIVVLFADKRPDLTLLPLIAHAGFAGVMLDTADKFKGGLRNQASHAFLVRFVARAKQFGLTAGLAGSLCADDIAPLIELAPDYLGFRSALCAANRSSMIDRGKMMQIMSAVRDARSLSSSATCRAELVEHLGRTEIR
jgi:dihydroneopterin aldolase